MQYVCFWREQKKRKKKTRGKKGLGFNSRTVGNELQAMSLSAVARLGLFTARATFASSVTCSENCAPVRRCHLSSRVLGRSGVRSALVVSSRGAIIDGHTDDLLPLLLHDTSAHF